MVKYSIDIGRKYGLIIFIHFYCWICRPRQRLRKWSTIVQLCLNLYIGLVWIKRKTSHTFWPKHLLNFINPHGLASILIDVNIIIDRLKCRRSMVLWPIEFNTCRNPWTRKTNQRRLNYLIVINEMPVSNFVVRHLHAPTQLREYKNFEILIF